ncbi:MAG: SprT-like domain-containing protein [Candidatus Hydrogenedens sp.]|nr:SprT-like domain-containing protein [Candidatus Hydrogenedens sp.]
MRDILQLEFDFDSIEKRDIDINAIETSSHIKHQNNNTNQFIKQPEKFLSYLKSDSLINNIAIHNEQNKVKIIINVKTKKRVQRIYYALPSIFDASINEWKIIKNVFIGKFASRELVLPILKKYQIYKNPIYRGHKTHQGEFYDLRYFFNKLNHEYFENHLTNNIFWSKSKFKKRARGYLLGYFNWNSLTVYISQLLDSNLIPEEVLEVIIYHELVHAFIFTQQSIYEKPHGLEFKKYYYRHPKAKIIEKFINTKEFETLMKKVIQTKKKRLSN